MSDFFEPPLPVEPVEGRRRNPWEPPRAVVPAVVAVEKVVGRSDLAAVYLSSLEVYPTGFEFGVYIVARADRDLDPFPHRRDREAERAGRIPPGRLRLGLAFADGTKTSNTKGPPPTAEGSSSPRMLSRSGRGTEGEWSQTFWVWPLPPPGPLEFVCEWPDGNLPLTRTGLDAEAIVAAAARARSLFTD